MSILRRRDARLWFAIIIFAALLISLSYFPGRHAEDAAVRANEISLRNAQALDAYQRLASERRQELARLLGTFCGVQSRRDNILRGIIGRPITPQGRREAIALYKALGFTNEQIEQILKSSSAATTRALDALKPLNCSDVISEWLGS